MARKDYIEKITQNLEHLTKDELKDVAALTNAQFGVRFKVAEKEYWGKEIADLKSQLQQQALPVVPECVAVQIERVKNSNGNFATLGLFDWNHEAKPDYTKWIHENVFDFMRACTIGYTVEKPQLFYIEIPNIYGFSDSLFVSKVENGTIFEFTKGKDYALALNEQEIKSINERYWQFAVPVEDEE